jgi:hypothetical protein
MVFIIVNKNQQEERFEIYPKHCITEACASIDFNGWQSVCRVHSHHFKWVVEGSIQVGRLQSFTLGKGVIIHQQNMILVIAAHSTSTKHP